MLLIPTGSSVACVLIWSPLHRSHSDYSSVEACELLVAWLIDEARELQTISLVRDKLALVCIAIIYTEGTDRRVPSKKRLGQLVLRPVIGLYRPYPGTLRFPPSSPHTRTPRAGTLPSSKLKEDSVVDSSRRRRRLPIPNVAYNENHTTVLSAKNNGFE